MKDKKVIGILLALTVLLNTMLCNTDGAMAASQTSATTTVSGSISASIISVSVPASMAFTVDPNNPISNSASESVIQNNTNAPIEISIGGGGSYFKQSPASVWKPVDYLPEELDWENLGKAASESSLALGLKVKDVVQWRKLTMTDILWVKELAGITGSAIIGQLDPNSSATITFQFRNGNAFSEPKSCAYNITWSFTLAE
jgi:hypothetical protein